MGVLWYSIGASPAYEMFVGGVELLAGILLFIPPLATIGAMVSLAASIQIFTLNMTYDVPVKLFSFHLVLMSAFLLAPEAGRLARVLVLNRSTGPSTLRPLTRHRLVGGLLVAAQVTFGGYLAWRGISNGLQSWRTFGGGAPKVALYGIWDVERMTIDGVERAPLLIDYDRWRRVVIQDANGVRFQRMDDTMTFYGAKTDAEAGTIALTSAGGSAGTLTFTRSAPDRLTLEGRMDQRDVRLDLRRVDHEAFELVRRGFHWIQDYPYNR
jgi:hypothetical protein